jgi:hypothetical protein
VWNLFTIPPPQQEVWTHHRFDISLTNAGVLADKYRWMLKVKYLMMVRWVETYRKKRRIYGMSITSCCGWQNYKEKYFKIFFCRHTYANKTPLPYVTFTAVISPISPCAVGVVFAGKLQRRVNHLIQGVTRVENGCACVRAARRWGMKRGSHTSDAPTFI